MGDVKIGEKIFFGRENIGLATGKIVRYEGK